MRRKTTNSRTPVKRKIWLSLRILISLSLCPLLLSSCLSTVQLNERAIVQAVGIDLEQDGQLRLTLQVFAPSTGGGGSISATADNAKIIEASGATVSEAIQNATLIQGKQLFVGHNRIILIGSALAERGMEQPLSYFASSTWSRQNVYVAMAENKASDILKAKINQGILPAETLEKIVVNTENNGMMKSVRMYEFLKSMENSYESSILPVMTVKKEPSAESDENSTDEGGEAGGENPAQAGEEIDEVSSVSIIGTAVFSGMKLKGTLNREESRGLLWILNDMKQTILTVSTDQFQTAALRVYQSDSKLIPSVQNGVISYTLKVHCEASMGDCIVRPGEEISLDNIESLAKAGEQAIAAECAAAFQKAAVEGHSDIFNLGNAIWQEDTELWRTRKDNWQERLNEVTFQTEVQMELDRVGLEFQQTDRESTESMTSQPAKASESAQGER